MYDTSTLLAAVSCLFLSVSPSFTSLKYNYRKNWVTAPVFCPFFWQNTMVQWTIRPKNLAINMGVL